MSGALSTVGKWFVSILGGWFSLASIGFLIMGTIFMTPGNGTPEQYAYVNILLYSSFLLAPVLLILHIWGQIKFWKMGEGDSRFVPLLTLFSPILIVTLFFVLAFTLASYFVPAQ